MVKQLTAPLTSPEISHARFTHLQKLNQWEVMLPQGGLGWLSAAFKNAEKSK